MLVGFPRLKGRHRGAVDRDLGAVFDGQNLESVVSGQIAVHRNVFRAQNVVRDDLIPHQIRAPSERSPAAGIVVHGDCDWSV